MAAIKVSRELFYFLYRRHTYIHMYIRDLRREFRRKRGSPVKAERAQQLSAADFNFESLRCLTVRELSCLLICSQL